MQPGTSRPTVLTTPAAAVTRYPGASGGKQRRLSSYPVQVSGPSGGSLDVDVRLPAGNGGKLCGKAGQAVFRSVPAAIR